MTGDGQAQQHAALVLAGDGGHGDDLRLALGGIHIGNLAGKLVQALHIHQNVVKGIGAQPGELGLAAGDRGGQHISVCIGAGDGQQTVSHIRIQGYRQFALGAGDGNAVDGQQIEVLIEPIGKQAHADGQNQQHGDHQGCLAPAVLFHIHRGHVLHDRLADGAGPHFRVFGGLQQVLYGVQLAVQIEIVLGFRGDHREYHIVLRLLGHGHTGRGEADGALIQNIPVRLGGGSLVKFHADGGIGNGGLGCRFLRDRQVGRRGKGIILRQLA